MFIALKANYKLDIVKWPKPGTNDTLPIRFYYNQGENPSAMKNMIIPLADFYRSDSFEESAPGKWKVNFKANQVQPNPPFTSSA